MKKIISPSKRVEINFESEGCISGKPAKVEIYENGKIIAIIEGKTELQPGADRGLYHCTVLKQISPPAAIKPITV